MTVALVSALAHARLTRGERRIGIEVKVCAQDLVEPTIDDDGTIHLGKLEQAVAREGDIQRKAVVTRGEYGVGVAHTNEGSDVPRDDHVEGGAHRLTGRREAYGLPHAIFCSMGVPPRLHASPIVA